MPAMSIASGSTLTLLAAARPARPTSGKPWGNASAEATGELGVDLVAGQSTVTSLRATSPLRLLVPRARGPSVWAYMSNLGGGLVAGDQTRLEVRAGAGTVCYLGTQGSTKIYRCTEGRTCRQQLRATLATGARLILAPDPVTCFAAARFEQCQRFELAPAAGLVLVDWFTAGRQARGERWAFDGYDSRNEIWLDGTPVLRDALHLDPAAGPLTDPYRCGRFDCFAVLVLVGEPVRAAAAQLLARVAAKPAAPHGDLVLAASPLAAGALLRVAGRHTEAVARLVRDQLEFVCAWLQDDPWARKW